MIPLVGEHSAVGRICRYGKRECASEVLLDILRLLQNHRAFCLDLVVGDFGFACSDVCCFLAAVTIFRNRVRYLAEVPAQGLRGEFP